MALKALLIDDEYPARKKLRHLLQDYKNVQIVGEAATVEEALQLINAMNYSILFLNTNMPDGNGVEFIKKLNKMHHFPFVIFVTAYAQYALDAFSINAVDYVLKPVEAQRLDQALQKLFRLIENTEKKNGEAKPYKLNNDHAGLGLIPVEHKGKIILLEDKNIIFVYASGDYAYIKTADEKYLTRFTLKELEKRLDRQLFFRCHRSYLINLKKTQEVTSLYNGTLLLTVDDNERSEVPVSRSQAKYIRKLLGL